MYEDAQEIFGYLPIRKTQVEYEYIEHLRNVFLVLDQTENTARPFLIMPFHLLFMMALQYKALRVSINHTK